MEQSREASLRTAISDEPPFRLRQAEEALYSGHFGSWEEVSTLSKTLRRRISASVPWNTLSDTIVLGSTAGDSWKAALRTEDGMMLESVLMRNARGHLTACVSTQIGCAMNCAFCSTGKMGFTRNLSSDEVVDQVRFFVRYVGENGIEGEITNVVFMGMGEPLANYESVREALRILTEKMGIGLSRITVSTVGILPALRRLLDDSEWPNVRLAISLHAVDEAVRKRIMPSTSEGFIRELVSFARDYARRFPERRRHLTLEYLLLSGVNDSADDCRKLAKLAHTMGRVRVNLIPYNATDSGFFGSGDEATGRFREALERASITVTVRKSLGGDIAAACGQLAGKRVSEDGKRRIENAMKPRVGQ